MSDALEAINFIRREVQVQSRLIFSAVVAHAHRSIQEGSEITGAPGQPVDTGQLRISWQVSKLTETEAVISCGGDAAKYAMIIETGIRPIGRGRGNATGRSGTRITLRSPVGGFHSIQLTLDGLQRIIDFETRKLA
jgi:hypothetical protein